MVAAFGKRAVSEFTVFLASSDNPSGTWRRLKWKFHRLLMKRLKFRNSQKCLSSSFRSQDSSYLFRSDWYLLCFLLHKCWERKSPARLSGRFLQILSQWFSKGGSSHQRQYNLGSYYKCWCSGFTPGVRIRNSESHAQLPPEYRCSCCPLSLENHCSVCPVGGQMSCIKPCYQSSGHTLATCTRIYSSLANAR